MHDAKLAWTPVIAALLLGFALFVTNLDGVDLWADEGWTIAASAESSPVDVVSEWVVPDVHPPLYFVALQTWRTVTGDTIFEMRYFSVMVSLLGIAFAYQAGRGIFSNRAGLLAALFYALHDLVLVQTQEVRHYSGQMTMVALTLWLYWRFYRLPSRKRGIAFVLAAAALMYTHYWGAFIVLALGVQALITRVFPIFRGETPPRFADDKRRLMLAFVAVGLLFLPWLPALIHQITLERPGGLPHALENTNWVMRVLLFQLFGVPEVFWIVLMVAGSLGAFALAPRRWRPNSATLTVLLAVIVPPALSILINIAYPILSFRALAVIVPPAMILAAHGLSRFRLPEMLTVTAFVVVFSLTGTSARPIDRPDWPTIAEQATSHIGPGSAVLLENDTDEYALAYYVDQASDVPVIHTEHVRDFTPEHFPDFFAESVASLEGAWIAKLGWPGEEGGDIRPLMTSAGFVQSAPEVDYGMYNDRPILLWRMDRIPQEPPTVTYGDLLRLYRPHVRLTGDGDHLVTSMLWSPLAAPPAEYRVSILVFRDGAVVTNQDSMPLDGASPTTTWIADGWYYDSHAIPTADLSPGRYQIGVQVYAFTDETFSATENLSVDDCSDDADCRFVFVGEAQVP